MPSGSPRRVHEDVQEGKVTPRGTLHPPQMHSSSTPPTKPSKAVKGNGWHHYCQLRLRDAIKSDGLKRFWAMTRVQNQLAKPHCPPSMYAPGMSLAKWFQTQWLQSLYHHPYNFSPTTERFCSLVIYMLSKLGRQIQDLECILLCLLHWRWCN